MPQTNTYTAASAPPLCGPFKHLWQEEYYGWKCAVCALFIPFGCEPWAPLDDEGEEDVPHAD